VVKTIVPVCFLPYVPFDPPVPDPFSLRGARVRELCSYKVGIYSKPGDPMMNPKDHRTSAKDRRTSARYTPAVDQSQIGWWDGKQFRTTSATLQDISTGGAALTIDGQILPVDGEMAPATVWMCVVGQEPTEWVQSRIAGATTGEDGTRRVRLAFTEHCPYEVFKASVWGNPAAQPPRAAPGAGEQSAPPTSVPPGDRPPLPRRLPDRRQTVALSHGDELTCVVVASAAADGPPTLYEAERSQRVLKDRVAVLPWAMAFVMGLAVAAMLGMVVVERLGQFRQVETRVSAANNK
jgi:hypothetical protein